MKKIYALLVFGLFSLPIMAQTKPIIFNNKPINLNSDIESFVDNAKPNESYIIKAKTTLTPQELASMNFKLINSLGNNHYIIHINEHNNKEQNSNILLGWKKLEPNEKLSESALAATGMQQFVVKLIATDKEQLLNNVVLELGGTTPTAQQWSKQGLYTIELYASKLLDLAQHPFVAHIATALQDEPLLEHAKYYTGASTAILPTSLGGRNLKGNHIVVGVGDDAHPFHLDLNDRLINFNPLNASTHGYHVATTVGGAGIIDERYTGFAPKSKIVTNYFSNIISQSEVYAQDFGMTITNNSYGAELTICNSLGLYSIYSEAIDEQLRNNPKIFHVFAAGNSAARTCAPYPYSYRTVAGHYQPSKNVLTVANIGKTETSFNNTSSIGPTRDGRIKPEISAMGSGLIAGGNNNNYFSNTGTSMASPNVAGASSLLQERYVQLKGSLPEADITKALLMNGATDIGTVGPDFKFGFGLMNLEHSLQMLEGNKYVIDTINTNQNKSFIINVPASTKLLKVMLYWADAPGNPSAAKSLVNDLDLTATHINTSTVYQPWILNPSPDSVANEAKRGVDRLNNVEQVTITDPQAGDYTITVNGYDVSIPNQRYIVVYETVGEELQLRFPRGGEKILAGNSQYIYWESPYNTPNTTVQFSSDNGTTWSTIANITNGAQRSLNYTFPATINSNKCLVRVIQNGYIATSANFSVGVRPTATIAPVNEQCPGNIKLNWTATANASYYKVFIKSGDEMIAVDTTSNLTYTYYGLNQDSTYWVGVASVIDTTTLVRSVSVSRRPNTGNNCVTNNGDLAILSITPNTNGRKYTNTEFGSATPLTVQIRNAASNSTSNYSVLYKINNAPWNTVNISSTIASNTTSNINVTNIDLSEPGKYDITVVIRNNATTDLVPQNDTIKKTIFHWANDTLSLFDDLVIDFENHNFKYTNSNIIGIDSIEYLDMVTTSAYGEFTSFINSSMTLSGNRSLGLHTNRNIGNTATNASKNELIATFNLSNQDTATSEIRLEFEYMLATLPAYNTNNSVWLRNNENSTWVKVMDYAFDSVNFEKQHSGSISLQNIFKENNWNFTESVQVKWEQYSNTLLSSPGYGDGLVLDNIKLYKVSNDVFVVGTDSLFHYNCQLSNNIPVRVKVGNGVNNTVYDVAVSYQLDNGPIITEYIDSIAGKDTITYTFTAPIDLSAIKTYELNSWVFLSTDTYSLNDSLIKFKIINQPVITSFPYFQNFEENDGFFLPDGRNSSWAYGTPKKSILNKAASGTKAWLTDTTNNYNDFELSSLYAPCFDLTGLANPHLSFTFFYHLEQPNGNDTTEVYDYSFVEYSVDGGATWQKLGTDTTSTNSYNHPTQVFTGSDKAYWRVVTMPIPKDATQFTFRINMTTDANSNFQGLGVDDIHIYDYSNPIYAGDSLNTPIITNSIANNWVNAQVGNDIIASVITNSATGSFKTNAYLHQEFTNDNKTQYYIPRSYVIQDETNNADSVSIKIYVEDKHFTMLKDDNTCPSCYLADDMYRMGITIYNDEDNNLENGTLKDNLSLDKYTYIPYQNITWTPYGTGYIGTFKTNTIGEIWISGGGPTQDQSLDNAIILFSGYELDHLSANLNWFSLINEKAIKYTLERQYPDEEFQEINIQLPTEPKTKTEAFNYIDRPNHKNSFVNYRLKYSVTNDSNKVYYSPIVTLNWSNFKEGVFVYPNPIVGNTFNISWFKKDELPLSWAMYTSSGQLVSHQAIDANPQFDKIQVRLDQIGKLSSGIYILRVFTEQNTYDFKLSILNR